jgi:hypothetical protein
MDTKLKGDIAEQAAVFDFALFIAYGSEIQMVEREKE